MRTDLFIEMLKATDDEFIQEKLQSSNYLINKICENKDEVDFINYLIHTVKIEMFAKLDKQIETFKFFA